MSDPSVSYKFSGHQTFPFRYGWLEKGVRGVEKYSDIFSRDDALVQLGVGKNMVYSIRHWCQITQLVEPLKGAKRNSRKHLQVTNLGRKLLLDGRWDPFLEDDASLWLIHWLLVTNPSVVTSWKLLFGQFHRPDFTKQELLAYVTGVARKEQQKTSDRVIARDVDCLLRTYCVNIGGKKRLTPEESFDCPLLQLDLLQSSPDTELYKFAIGPQPSLPAAIFSFALDQHFERTRSGRETMSVQECLYGPGSPGQVFKLDENSLIGYIEELDEITGGAIAFGETADVNQIYRKQAFDPMVILEEYYSGEERKA